MSKIENRGTITKIYSSGIVESDKGFKYPYNKAKIGDVMIDVDGDRRVVSKEEYRKNYRSVSDKGEE